MNILLLTSISGGFPFIEELKSELIKKESKVCIIDLFDNVIISVDGKKINFPFVIRILAKIPKIGILFSVLYGRFFLFANSKKFDILNIHFFSPVYYFLFLGTNKYSRKLIATIWGSDVYRASKRGRKLQNRLLKKIKYVSVAGQQMKNDFLNYYSFPEKRVLFLRFGIAKFELIKNLLKNESPLDIKKELSFPLDKIVVACGYNGRPEQQHSIIINAVSTLPEEFKKELVLFFIMSYGASFEYIEGIKGLLKLNKLQYIIFEDFLTDEKVAKLRIASDIVINIQTTDGLSASLQEHFLAGNILILGDWLPYDIFDQIGLKYQKTSINSLRAKLLDVLQNRSSYLNNCMNNGDKIYKLNSWGNVIDSWIETFGLVKHV